MLSIAGDLYNKFAATSKPERMNADWTFGIIEWLTTHLSHF
jgi:hypothetical protein